MSNLMNRKLIWDNSIPIDFPLTDNISNARNCVMDGLIVWKGNKLDYKYLKSVDEKVRDEIAKDLLNYFLDYDFSKFNIEKKNIDRDWASLCTAPVSIKEIDGEKQISNMASTGNKIYKYFFPNILKISTDNKISVYDALRDKKILFDIIRNRVGNTLLYNNKGKEARQWPMSISARQMIQGAKCSGLASIGSIFKPVVAKTIYNYWVKPGDIVYDYSCGFGGRLLGLKCLNHNNRYIGAEPNTETYNNLKAMTNYFKWDGVEIINMGSEDIELNNINFAFSSPCYFDKERYCSEGSQCYIRYGQYDEWLEEYWRKTVKNIKKMLVKGGIFGVNIGNDSNDFMRKIAEDFKGVIEQEGFGLKEVWWMRTARSHLSNKKKSQILTKPEGIYFYGK